jgi:hypothetical protein
MDDNFVSCVYLGELLFYVVRNAKYPDGSILHRFAAINYVAGIKKLTGAPYCHPPDELNDDGLSPLLVALKYMAPEAIECLLELDVDVLRPDPETSRTPVQLLLTDIEFWDKEQFSEIALLLLKKGIMAFMLLPPKFSDGFTHIPKIELMESEKLRFELLGAKETTVSKWFSEIKKLPVL